MVNSYVALGDSFTAGNGIGSARRWPDLLASELASGNRDFSYLNLARDGADSQEVMKTIDPTIALQPDLVTLICGANDVLLTTRPDITGFECRYEHMIGRLKRTIPDVKILVSTYPDGWAMPGLGPRTRKRVDEGVRLVNQTVIRVSDAHDIPCLDVTSHPGVREPGNLDVDGLHPSALGHRRAAREYAKALHRHFGITPDDRRITA